MVLVNRNVCSIQSLRGSRITRYPAFRFHYIQLHKLIPNPVSYLFYARDKYKSFKNDKNGQIPIIVEAGVSTTTPLALFPPDKIKKRK